MSAPLKKLHVPSSDTLSLNNPVICIVGPTASGKSHLAQEIALSIQAEIVSADSMQIYRGMDIGTGKVFPHEMKVKHWGIDICDPGEPYSASLYQNYARNCFSDIDNRGSRIVLCGGTGFYVRAAIDDMDFPAGEQQGNPMREYYQAIADEQGNQVLWEMLREKDPDSASIIHPNNSRRVIRAFEMIGQGLSYAQQHKNFSQMQQKVPALFLGLQVEKEPLVAAIDERVEKMIDSGLVKEVETLLEKGFRAGITSAQAIGYKEIVAALEGDCTLDQAIADIKTASHRYAKKQRTWFKKDTRITWISVDLKHPECVFDEAMHLIMDKIS